MNITLLGRAGQSNFWTALPGPNVTNVTVNGSPATYTVTDVGVVKLATPLTTDSIISVTGSQIVVPPQAGGTSGGIAVTVENNTGGNTNTSGSNIPQPEKPTIVSQNGTVLTINGIAGKLLHLFKKADVLANPATATPIGSVMVGQSGTVTVDLASLPTGVTKIVGKQATLVYSDFTADFDYLIAQDWRAYGEILVDLTVDPFVIAQAGGRHYLRVRVNKPVEQTVQFEFYLRNGDGANKLYDPAHFTQPADQTHYFRPGDDTWLDLPIDFASNLPMGANVWIVIRHIWGTTVDFDGLIEFNTTVQATGNNVAPVGGQVAYHRPPVRLGTSAVSPTASLDIQNMEWGANGVKNGVGGKWNTALKDDQREQSGNGEYGLYGDAVLFPGMPNPHVIELDGNGNYQLRLHTAKLTTPQAFNSVSYNYLASCLTTQHVAAFSHRYGVWEADITCPDRLAAWAAWWAMVVNSLGAGGWPFEIDVFEMFNHVTGQWGPNKVSGGVHVGVPYSNARQFVCANHWELDKVGFAPGMKTSDRHKMQIEITADYITWYYEGIETFTIRNFMDVTMGALDLRWYWIFNVAVGGAGVGDPGAYTGGTGDMTLHAFKYWTSRAGMTVDAPVAPYTSTGGNAGGVPSPTPTPTPVPVPTPTPTPTPPGGGITFDAASKSSSALVLTNGNMTAENTGSTWQSVRLTVPLAGKTDAEVKVLAAGTSDSIVIGTGPAGVPASGQYIGDGSTDSIGISGTLLDPGAYIVNGAVSQNLHVGYGAVDDVVNFDTDINGGIGWLRVNGGASSGPGVTGAKDWNGNAYTGPDAGSGFALAPAGTKYLTVSLSPGAKVLLNLGKVASFYPDASGAPPFWITAPYPPMDA